MNEEERPILPGRFTVRVTNFQAEKMRSHVLTAGLHSPRLIVRKLEFQCWLFQYEHRYWIYLDGVINATYNIQNVLQTDTTTRATTYCK